MPQSDRSDTETLIPYVDGMYRTDPSAPVTRWLTTPNFYRQFLWNVYRSSGEARRGKYDGARWSKTSHQVMQSLESVGVRFQIEGIDRLKNLAEPCVLVGNHMSMLETIILPAIIRPVRKVTFVVKQSLLDYPVFRHILRSRNPIAVTRQNPREDFKAVMQGGLERLGNGISIVVFPQTTRANRFDPEQFNTIGIKLAAKAGVPVVPLALRTDAWSNGKWIKDFGPIDPSKTVHFAFGRPMEIQGRGDQQHQAVIDFIESHERAWNRSDSGS